MYAASRVWTRSTQEGVDRGKCCAADAAVIDGRTNECAAPQMQRQVDELEAEADQIADVSGEAAAEYHRLRQVLDRMSQIFCSCCSMCLCNGKHGSLHLLASKRRTQRHISPHLPMLLQHSAAGLGHTICCSMLQDISEQEAVILRAMLRPEKLLHFLRPGRLVSRCRAV